MPASPWVNQIQNFRERYEPWRRGLPVEITIIGSSGVGVFADDQNLEDAIKAVDQLAAGENPLSVHFSRRNSFPESNLYFFEPTEHSDLVRLQNKIVGTGLKFTKSPFPFTPHCTIADLGENPSPEALTDLNSIAVPTDSITIAALSFYGLVDRNCTLIHRSVFQKK